MKKHSTGKRQKNGTKGTEDTCTYEKGQTEQSPEGHANGSGNEETQEGEGQEEKTKQEAGIMRGEPQGR